MRDVEERLQKLLSARGIASRRAAEGYLLSGRVQVNGRTAVLGQRADPDRDEILIDGRPLPGRARRTYLALHKPPGYVTTRADDRGRRTTDELVSGCGVRVWPVGRLDYLSEGLLLLTDDGELTNRLIHPRHEVEKEYLVRVRGDVSAALPVLNGPMALDGVPLRPARVDLVRVQGGHTLLRFLLTEGKNRQIRRMCEQTGLSVNRLIRVREGPIRLGRLKPGCWRHLTQKEVDALYGCGNA